MRVSCITIVVVLLLFVVTKEKEQNYNDREFSVSFFQEFF
jgi:hypothetical protein